MNRLPTIESPKYRVKMPSTGKMIEIRPFTVREEKILLIAQESEDQAQIMLAIKTVMDSCIVSSVNINALTIYDFEYLFLQLRAKSIGETSEVQLKCPECEASNTVTINLSTIEVQHPEIKPAANIKINDSVGITLRQTSLNDVMKVVSADGVDAINEMDSLITMIMETIYDEADVYKVSDFSKEEVLEFVNSIPHSALEHIQKFVENQPVLKETVKFRCTECGKDNALEIEGITSFF